MRIDGIEQFLQKYQLILTIIIIPLLCGLWWGLKKLFDYIQQYRKKVLIGFTVSSSIIILMHMLAQRGDTNITMKKPAQETGQYRKIIPRKLGQIKEETKLKGKGTKEHPIVITPKDVLNFEVKEHDL